MRIGLQTLNAGLIFVPRRSTVSASSVMWLREFRARQARHCKAEALEGRYLQHRMAEAVAVEAGVTAMVYTTFVCNCSDTAWDCCLRSLRS